MHDTLDQTSAHRPESNARGASGQSLSAGWFEGLAIVNLRGDPDDGSFREEVSRALGLELPVAPCTSVANGDLRIVWAGPDEWFVIGARGEAAAIAKRIRGAVAGMHHAVTDVSSGYSVLHLSGAAVRGVLAQGCPIDLHSRSFKPGASAGTHYFKASIIVWQTAEAPIFEVLVRRSFMGYVWLMLQLGTQECGLIPCHSA